MKTLTLEAMREKLSPIMWGVGFISFFINLLVLPVSIYSLQVLDRVIGTGSLHTLLWLTAIMLLMFAAAGVLQTLRGIILTRAGEWLHDSIAEATLPMVLATAASGNRGAQPLRDASALKQFIAGPGLTAIMDAPWSILFIIGLFIIHAYLGFLVTFGAVALMLLAWLNETAMREPLKEAGMRQMRSMHELEFAARNAEVTEAMGMSATLTQRWKDSQTKTSALQIQASDRSNVIMGGTKFVRLSLQIMITCIATWLAIEGKVTIGAIIAASILASRALAPFEAAISSWKSLLESRAAYDRLDQMLGALATQQEAMALPPPVGMVQVEHLTYQVPGREKPLLDDIHFAIRVGESIGIIGPSGSGKSTLARLLIGVRQPTNGIVRLDGADVTRWPREDVGQYIGYLPQDVELFSGTVRDNIARFKPDADAEAVVTAAKIASAHDLILRLPQGYDTEIGPGGGMLSGGQRQRIGLARAFFGFPKFLVLDEPDASLDDAGQAALMNALQFAKSQRVTSVIITHRRSLLSHTDRVVLLVDGALQAYDTLSAVQAIVNAQQAKPGTRSSSL